MRDIRGPIATDIDVAIAPSHRQEHGQPVGYDVFRISGHGRVGETVYLTLTYDQWVRTIDQVTVSPTSTTPTEGCEP